MLVTSILDQVRRDVASFADPSTEVQITDRSLSWVRSRVRLTAQLLRRPGFPDVSYNNREYTYTGFLASEALADLKDLAATILATTAPPPHYVPVYARTERAGDRPASTADASSLVLTSTIDASALPIAATRVLFVHGNAGTGKTSTLLQVTRRQADLYLQGQASTLYLYLDAQGKGLSQLEDVMARALQDLRAKFTYHSVAALTRRHCVVPIVDGFDELIGPSSAREAFANLTQFLAQLDCEGAFIASSRSAFIDYRTLHERAAELAASQNLSYEIVPLEILPWTDDAIARYCHERASSTSTLTERVFALMASPAGSLVRKPFFLSRICDILEEGGHINVEGDITRQVVDAALSRETTKLRDERGRELLTIDQHRTFCETIADEMWSLASPDLDSETIRLLAEVIAEHFGLGPRDTKTLVDRSIAHGLLTVVPGRTPDKRAFEHELFRFEFQAGVLAKALARGTDASRDYLQRAELPLEILSRLPSFGVSDSDRLPSLFEALNKIIGSSPHNQFASTNAGSVAWALLHDRGDLPEGLRLHAYYFRSHDLGSCQLHRAFLLRCLFERVDLSRAQLTSCAVDGTQFIGCALGSNTSLSGTVVEATQFVGITDIERGREVYDPREIIRILRGANAVLPETAAPTTDESLSEVIASRVDVVERLLTHARSHFYLSRNENWFRNNLQGDAAWERVEQLLRRHRLLEEVSLIKSGAPEKFLRLTTAPDKILQARVSSSEQAPPNAVRFWAELLADHA